MNKIQTISAKSSKPAEASKPRRLGRGLSSLIGTPVAVEATPRTPKTAPLPPAAIQEATRDVAGSEGEPTGRVVHLPLERIRPGRHQPRRTFDDAQLAELAASIKAAGVVQPVVVRAAGAGSEGASYELVAGERRWRASRLAGLETVPAVIAELSDEQAAEWALIENLQRADLSPMERAFAVRGLCETFGLTHAQVAEKLGIDRSSVANLVRLTELEEPVRALIESGSLSAGHGKVLLGVPAGPGRVALAQAAAEGSWSVRRLEESAARAQRAPSPAPAAAASQPTATLAQAALADLERQLGEHLGTKVQVRVRKGGKSGALLLRFYDLDHFDGLMAKMGFVLR